MQEELQTAISSGKLTPEAAEVLEQLQPGAFCLHKSWGFGKVKEWNLFSDQIIIDFQSKKGHAMQAPYAAESLHPIPSDHILARIAEDREGVAKRAKEDPVGLVRQILTDFGGKATVDKIQSVLSPDVLDAAAYKKWWDATKKKLKADGHFVVPAKKTEPLVIHEKPIDRSTELLETFFSVRQLKQRIAAAEEIAKSFALFGGKEGEIQKVIDKLDEIVRKNVRLHSAEALQLALVRDDLLEQSGRAAHKESEASISEILKSASGSLSDIFEKLPAVKQRHTLALLPDVFDDEWTSVAFRLIHRSQSRLVGEIVRLFESSGQTEEIRLYLERSIVDRSLTSETLHWLIRERKSQEQFVNIELFGAIIHALEEMHTDSDNRSSRLHDLVLEDSELIAELIADAPKEDIRNAVRRLLLTPVFEDLNKRSLLARIIRLHPEFGSMISGEDGNSQESITVSWASLERRKQEYDDLVNKQIPQNTRDISIARSYGDLRENFEFKSAKEMQAVLLRQKAELEQQLSMARGTNFENADTSQVSIGTTVILKNVETGEEESYHVLGAWDGIPERHVISYQTLIGQALLGHSPGEEVNLPLEEGTKKMRIVSISPFAHLEWLG